MVQPWNAVPPDEEALRAGAAALGVELTDGQATRLLAHVALIAKWNRVYNLTAIRRPAEMLPQHVLDSLTTLLPLDREGAGTKRLLDVGSGAGFPGVVIAVMRPDVQVTCIDAVGKKAAFLRQVGAELGLTNLTAVHERVETLRSPPFDVIASRAYAALGEFARQTRHLATPSTRWLAMKGRHPDAEMASLPSDIGVFHVEHVSIPGLDVERCLVWMRMAPSIAA